MKYYEYSYEDFLRNKQELSIEKAIKNFEPMQPGDVKSTSADTKAIENWIDFKPDTKLSSGIRNFIEWYTSYYK